MDVNNPQLIPGQLGENKLYLLKYDPNQFIADLNIDSVNRLKFKLMKENQSYPCCCICLDQFDEIAEHRNSKIIMSNCKHLYCAKDFEMIKLNNNSKDLKCVLCREKIISIFELQIWKENPEPLPNQLILNVVNYQRLDLASFTSQPCKNCGNQGLAAIVKCSLCLKPCTSYCVTCITRNMVEFVRQEYQRIIFYCGCSFSLNLFTLLSREPSDIEVLHAQYLSDPIKYVESLVSRIRSYNLEQVFAWQQKYCPLCPLKTFKFDYKKKEHIKRRHEDLYHLMYKETVRCQFCKKSYANDETMRRHKCKAVQAPQAFMNNLQ